MDVIGNKTTTKKWLVFTYAHPKGVLYDRSTGKMRPSATANKENGTDD